MVSKTLIFLVISILIALSLGQPASTDPTPSTASVTPRITTTTTTVGENTTTTTERIRAPTISPPLTVVPPITKRPTRPTRGPSRLCSSQNNCTRKNPSICGRNREGMCHRFPSICELQLTNCATTNPLNAWRRVPMMQCRNVRQNAIARCSVYTPRCPRPLPRCPRPTSSRGLCVMRRDRRLCRIVANRCTLRNLNCQVQSRQGWALANNANCRGMRAGGNPKKCTRRPVG